MSSATNLLRSHGQRIDEYLRSLRARNPHAPAKLLDAIDYSLLAGGKRLRPTLVLECFAACNGQHESSALAAAGAIELIHTFSLVHDDLPAMDDDDLRRGRPTNHKFFGEALAILAGDAMVTLAFEILAGDAHPTHAGKLIAELARATGPAGMIGGQVLDIAAEHQALSLDDLQQIHRMKTGALITAACRLGAIAAGADDAAVAALTTFGQHLGLAFQIVDDILDVISSPAELGKATGKDISRGKNTYPALLGLPRSKEKAADELADAITSLDTLKNTSQNLKILAEFVVSREL
jgi:geranylgeranyl diphosphate synthase, type II